MEKTYHTANSHNKKITISMGQRMMAIALLLVVMVACSKSGSLTEPDLQDPLEESEDNLLGSLEEVKNFYTTEFVDAMVDLEFNINLGNNPPNLEGSYLISPFILEDSTVEQDSAAIGGQFQDYLATFSNQNNNSLTIDLEGIQDGQEDDGSGSFITGDGGAFTVYSKTISQQGSSKAETAVTISGILSPNGIINIQFFGAMLDDNGDPQGVFIENNTGRLLVDGDDFSSKQTQTSKTSSLNLSNWVRKLE